MFSWVLRKKLALKKIAGESRNEGIEMYRSIRRNAQGKGMLVTWHAKTINCL